MDILGELPVELSIAVLSFLNGKELCVCRCVSKKWKDLADYDILWKKVCSLEHPKELTFIGTDNSYAKCWRRALRNERKWTKNEYWSFSKGEIIEAFPLANGAILCCVNVDSSMFLYDLNSPDAKIIQHIPPFSNIHLTTNQFQFFTLDNSVTVSVGNRKNGVKVYTFSWREDELWKGDMFHCISGQNNGIEVKRGEGIPIPEITLKRVMKNGMVWRDWPNVTDYFYDGTSVTGKTQWGSMSWRDHAYADTYFLCSRKSIIGFDMKGCPKMCLDIADVVSSSCDMAGDINLDFNKDIILVLVTSVSKKTGIGWLWKDTAWRLPSVVTTRHDLMLHPNEPLVVYINQPDLDMKNYEVITKAMETDEIMAVVKINLIQYISIPCDVSFFIMTDYRHSLYMLHYRPIHGKPEKNQIYLDLEKGTVIFIENSNNFSIKQVTSKFLMDYEYKGGSKSCSLRVYT